MRRLMLLLAAIFLPAFLSFSGLGVYAQESVCIECHLAIDVPELTDPVREFRSREEERFLDVHAREGFSCHHCHGGDPQDIGRAKDPAAGYIGKPDPRRIPQLCAECHSDIEFMRRYNPRLPTDQHRLYETSQHGKLLLEGDVKVATCASCHSAHRVLRGDDPRSPVYVRNIPETCAACHSDADYMAEYGIPTDQLESYRKSRHGMLLAEGDTSAPACNSCHGNHGAIPPLVASVHHVCGQCHAQHDEYFEQSTHGQIFEVMGFPGCATCHGHHDIPPPSPQMLSNEPGSVCMTCHEEGDRCYLYVAEVRELFDTVQAEFDQTELLLGRAERMGLGVQQAQFQMSEIRDHFIRARIKIHRFESGVVQEELEAALAIVQRAQGRGEEALREYQMRRVGLAVSLVFIALFMTALIMKIRMRTAS